MSFSSPPASNRLQRIVLTGFMGSGKTTVGRLLAARLGWVFADLDEHIERHAGRTVPQIFTDDGEAAFRAAEARVLAELLKEDRVVIALGGGAPGTAAVRDLLAAAQRTTTVHLDAPFNVLYERCTVQARDDPQATSRPLLGERAATERRYRERRELFAAVAQYTAEAADPPQAVVDAILSAVRV